ncbi:hypothetical protein LRLP16767_LR202_02156 [Limosilactobacillus reuteri]|uniref:Uncharacterized protein n=2 Tax=Limosilactobacillus TaxID=2742598 RepID=A0A7W3TYY1_9LACO|nr:MULTISPECIES: hypothetical protein [Limosilactobacillus]MBB1085881.1 hypothetical protein [Limosilactobacillus fastidiosus]MCD7085782.1 hypothetical protein [Limosilactobacillus fastidiosus]MCD7113859.1 hypothetical protein [Limosilactobacillus fastidiosus]MCD7115691.1 hypothetical protein [Limosilactobacillus fastidiosus]CUR42496.1 hypothetical protein LRLP16767_LR202_02156 [Limosilactobacillus reuteri]
MFNFGNSGYLGNKRSVRSEQAIESHEVPLSWITRSEINDTINDLLGDKEINDNEAKWLRKIPVYVWKAQEATSWHHTGKYFNRTPHYDLTYYAEEFLDDKQSVKDFIEQHRKNLKTGKKKQQYTIASYSHNVWGGTKKHPKLIGEEWGYGVLKGNKIIPVVFYMPDRDIYESDKKYYLCSSKNLTFTEYDNYEDLIKHEGLYKSTKRKLNKVLKEHHLE